MMAGDGKTFEFLRPPPGRFAGVMQAPWLASESPFKV